MKTPNQLDFPLDQVTESRYLPLAVYNKLFTKILDSSIWLEPVATRIVWLTMIAAMDEDGFVEFAAPANVSRRANLDLEPTLEAIKCLESPDKDSSDPDNDGRRIERVNGGWVVLNATKYRAIVTSSVAREKTRLRVQRFRESKKNQETGNVTCNAAVTPPSACAVDPASDSSSLREETCQQTSTPVNSCTEPSTHRGFIKPTLDELEFAMQKSGLPSSEAQKFLDYYESIGWKVGKNKMISWEHAVRNWAVRVRERITGPPKIQTTPSADKFNQGNM